MFDTVERPWGEWTIIDTAPVTKIISVKPGGMLSLQTHRNRAELWIPNSTGLIRYMETYEEYSYSWVYPESEVMRQGNSYNVPKMTKHRLINPTDKKISLIEIINGDYDEEDIVRYQDIYDRS